MSQAGLLDIEASHPQIPTSFVTDTGTAIPLSNVLEILGGDGIYTTASGNTVTVSANIATAGATLPLSTLGVAAFDNTQFTVINGFVQISTGFVRTTSFLTDSGLPAVLSDALGQIHFASAGGLTIQGVGPGNIITFGAGSTIPTSFITDFGIAIPNLNSLKVLGGHNISTFELLNNLTIDLTGTTNHAIQVGNITGSLTSLGIGVTGSVLLGNTGADPSFSGAMTDGTLLIGNTGNNPSIASLTSSGGTVAITAGAGTINLEALSGAMTWSNINASATLVVNTGVNCTAGAALSLALPAVSAVGDVIRIVLDGSTSWTITQAANQQIRVGTLTTTLGVGGSVNSLAQGDFIEMVCKTANLVWTAIGFTGLNVI